MSENYRLPPDLGIVGHPLEMTVVVYRLVDEWKSVPTEYQAGGEITHHIKTGRRIYEAHRLGDPTLLDLTPELRAEIERDIGKRGLHL